MFLYDDLEKKINNSVNVLVYTLNGDIIKIKGDKNTSIIAVTPDSITVQFDSHISDIMFNAIEKIEYYGGVYVRNNFKKIKE